MPEVFQCPELDRIIALPRRPQEWTPEQTAEAVSLLTQWLKTPNGTWSLNAIQARALVEAHDVGAMVGLISAGGGKTLLSFLLPKIFKVNRTLLMVPAALREKTKDDYHDLKEQFQIPVLLDAGATPEPGQSYLRMLSYEALSTVGHATFIEEFDPELIIADEAQCLQSLKSGRSKRLFRFIKQKWRANEPVHFVPMTATGWDKTLKQIAHIADAALREKSPFPRDFVTLEQWSLAIDRKVKEEMRYKPGALLRLCSEDQKQAGLDGVRHAIRDRILSAPGIVATREVSCGIPLIFQRRHVEVPPEVRTAMAELRDYYRLPTGDSVEAGVTFWNHAHEVANGFAYYCDPIPPEEWRLAQAAWHAFVRNKIDYPGRLKLDTPLQVWNAAEAGHFGNCKEFDDWRNIRHTFKPKTKPYWISDYLVRDAEKWALENRGIVWVRHSTAYLDAGDDNDDLIGGMFKDIPYFGGGDERIKTYKGPCAASVKAHGTGKNLQQFDAGLFMGLPSGGKTMEQCLARWHRNGQKSEVVRAYFYAHSKENLNALETCIEDSRYVRATSGSDQRILNAHLLDVNDGAFKLDAYRERCEATGDPMWVEKAEVEL